MQAPRRGSWLVGCLRKTAILSLAVALPSALARGLPEASSEAEPDALRAERTEQDQAGRFALGVPTQCGDPVATDCFMGTFPDPYCNDMCNGEACEGCCEKVCGLDPGCCVSANEGGFGWDGFCADEAVEICDCLPGDEPPNDDCVNAIPVVLGDTAITNRCGTIGGPEHSATGCHDDPAGLPALGLDVWYTYAATFTGELVISTCDQLDSSWDSLLVIYEGCNCDVLSDPPLGCNNDGIQDDLTPCSFGSSLLRLDVTSGTCYTIRLGSSFQGVSGTGTLSLGVGSALACPIDDFIPPEAIPEPELCGENTNGGCDNLPDLPPAFTPVDCGDIILGTAFGDPLGFDTDWYELVITEPTLVTLSLLGEVGYEYGIAETQPKGSGDCITSSGQILPSEIVSPCQEFPITTLLFPGTHWPIVKPLLNDVPCGLDVGNDYLLTISCACDDPSVCNDDDPCTVDACALASGACSYSPTNCDDGDACTHDSCDSAVGCVHTPLNVQVECNDGDSCTVDACEPAVGCVHTPLCTLNTDCNDGHPCTADSCGANGCCASTPDCLIDADCPDPGPCATAVCGSGGCCLAVPDCERDCDCDDQNACTLDACSEVGCCENTPIDPAIACDDGDACTDESCDALSGCANTSVDPVVACDDSDACTIDTCDVLSGCLNTPIDPASCDDQDACTVDSCDAALGCVNTPIDPSLDCDDGDACTLDTCNFLQGCLHTAIDVAVVCDDDNPCTSDTCDPGVGCVSQALCALDGECDDLNDCTTDMCGIDGCCVNVALCQTGCPASDLDGDGEVSVPDLIILLAAWGTDPGGPPDFNGDGIVGVPDLIVLLAAWGPCGSTQAGTCCATEIDCDDGNACTADTCGAGGCCDNVPACITNSDCDDLDPCTINTCTVDGCCEITPNDCLGDTDCDDGDPCTTNTCGLDGCCVSILGQCAFDIDCDDGDPCTIDSCTVQGCCENRLRCQPGGFCSDGDPCTTDTCTPDGCCLGEPVNCQNNTECDDGDPCTTDVCEVDGCCTNTVECAANLDCDDSNACTIDVCSLPEGCCVIIPQCATAAECDDGNTCTADSCSAEGCCNNAPECVDATECDDIDACTTDTCTADGCCQSVFLCAVEGDCDDGDPCTADTCGADGCCAFTPQCATAADCGDENTCTTDTCTPEGCCVNTPECLSECDCDDQDSCTTDTCDGSGCCAFLPEPQCCEISDMNGDGFCTIVFDGELFVQCAYNGDCVGASGEDLVCPADCNCDGIASIVFDVECFVNNVFVNGTCGQCPLGLSADDRPDLEPGTPKRFTIGGAVFTDSEKPLATGVNGVDVTVQGIGSRVSTSATTNALGLWRIDNLPEGRYRVRVGSDGPGAPGSRDSFKVTVNKSNQAANMRLTWRLRSRGTRGSASQSTIPARRVVEPRGSD